LNKLISCLHHVHAYIYIMHKSVKSVHFSWL